MGDIQQPLATPILAGDTAKAPADRREKAPSETFKWLRGYHDKILEYQLGIGRWLMASLLVINGAGLLALLNTAEKYPAATREGGWFLAGVVLAVLTGAFAWLNCNCLTTSADYRTNFDQVDYQESAHADRWDRWGVGFAWASVAAAVLSLILFTTGALRAADEITSTVAAAAPSTAPTFTDEQMRVLENAGIAKNRAPKSPVRETR